MVKRIPAVYILDIKKGRAWEKLLPVGSVSCSYNPVDGLDSEGMLSGDILVFHHQDGTVNEAVKTLAKRQGVLVVAVDASGGTGREDPVGFYHRKRGVDRPTDDQFRGCFSNFIKNLVDRGEVDWQLVEGPPAPDALLAYYLLLRALPRDPEAIRKRQGLRSDALDEAAKIAAAKSTFFAEAVLDDASALRELLRDC